MRIILSSVKLRTGELRNQNMGSIRAQIRAKRPKQLIRNNCLEPLAVSGLEMVSLRDFDLGFSSEEISIAQNMKNFQKNLELFQSHA